MTDTLLAAVVLVAGMGTVGIGGHIIPRSQRTALVREYIGTIVVLVGLAVGVYGAVALAGGVA